MSRMCSGYSCLHFAASFWINSAVYLPYKAQMLIHSLIQTQFVSSW